MCKNSDTHCIPSNKALPTADQIKFLLPVQRTKQTKCTVLQQLTGKTTTFLLQHVWFFCCWVCFLFLYFSIAMPLPPQQVLSPVLQMP